MAPGSYEALVDLGLGDFVMVDGALIPSTGSGLDGKGSAWGVLNSDGKSPSWESRYPGRTTIDIAGLTTWSLFEPYADSAWMRRGADYERAAQLQPLPRQGEG